MKNRHLSVLAMLMIVPFLQAQASSLTVNYSQLDQRLFLGAETLQLDPQGTGVSVSFDLNEKLSVDASYQSWDDDGIAANGVMAEVDLTTYSLGVNYYVKDWSFSVYLSDSEDETQLARMGKQAAFGHSELAESTTLGVSAGYSWFLHSWMIGTNTALNYNDWDIALIRQSASEHEHMPRSARRRGITGLTDEQNQQTGGDNFSVSLGATVARFWSLNDDQAIMVGGTLSWEHYFSGEAVVVSRASRTARTRSGSRTRVNSANLSGTTSSASGDDSFGQLGGFISFVLSADWSVDFDASTEIASDYSTQNYSLTLGYYF